MLLPVGDATKRRLPRIARPTRSTDNRGGGERHDRGAKMDFKTFVFYMFATIMVLRRRCGSSPPEPGACRAVPGAGVLFTAGGIWMLLEAEFLAITLVMVYVGAVMVLFLFVVMMLDINLDRIREGFWSYLPLGAAIGLLMVAEMGMVLGGSYFGLDSMPEPPAAAAGYSNTRELGRLLYTDYVYPFELASRGAAGGDGRCRGIDAASSQGNQGVNPSQQIGSR